MKKMLLLAAAILFPGVASAADMAVKAPPPAPVVLYNWTGFYIGAHGGGGWGTSNYTSDWNCGVGTLCDSINQDISGGVAGGQIGYRWQAGNWVFGLEGTGAWADIRGTETGLHCTLGFNTCGGLTAVGSQLSYHTRLRDQFTVTGQIGYAVAQSLFYAKGGWAGGEVTRNLNFVTAIGTETTGNLNQWANGWTVGAGWEYMITPNWTFGLEYSFLSVEGGALRTNSIPTGQFISFITNNSSVRLDVSEVVARVNYKFGGPVVAKY
jgi:outer membrane immunogenic protein